MTIPALTTLLALACFSLGESGSPAGGASYDSDTESTKAQFETADEFELPGIGFWHLSSVDEATRKAVRVWLAR